MTTTATTETQTTPEPAAGKAQREPSRIPAYLTVSVLAAIWSLPSLGLLINSFRQPSDIRRGGWWTIFGSLFDSATWTIENYQVVLDRGFGNAFANSLAVTIPAVVIPITVAAFAAYAFAWMEFPGRNVIFITIVGLMVVPHRSTPPSI